MKAKRAPRRLGFDTVSYVSKRKAKAFVKSGYCYSIRYIRRDKHVNDRPDLSHWSVSLSKRELEEHLSAGLYVAPVQYGSWHKYPTKELGEKAGSAAGFNAKTLGLPGGVTIWCDSEWKTKPAAKDVIDYLNVWSYRVMEYGYAPGLYVGPGTNLSPTQLYEELILRHYWKSASIVPWPDKRGYQMIQGTQLKVHGILIDQDMTCIDNKMSKCVMVSA
ncbi:MAG: glycoside hydrolase domain-containing protein [Planctomycetota bacterium]|jgi:hypothetical protein